MNPNDKESAALRLLCESWLAERGRCREKGYYDPTSQYEPVFVALLQRLHAESVQVDDADEEFVKWIGTLTEAPNPLTSWRACAKWKDRVNANYKAQFVACHTEHDAERKRRMELEAEVEALTKLKNIYHGMAVQAVECEAHTDVIAPCCPVCLMEELDRLKREGYAPEGWKSEANALRNRVAELGEALCIAYDFLPFDRPFTGIPLTKVEDQVKRFLEETK